MIKKTKNPLKKNKTLNFKFDNFSKSDTYTINLLATFSGIKKWLLNEGEKFNFETKLTEENIKKLGLPYEKIRDAFRVEVKNTEEAKNLIVKNPKLDSH